MNSLTIKHSPHFKPCLDINQNLRYSQCIDIDTRIIQQKPSKECCSKENGKYLSKLNLCINPSDSNYGICCMGYTNNDIMVGIWSNFTLVEGFMAHSKKQLDCAKKHRKNKKSKEDKVKDKNLPRLNLVKSSNKQISAYDDLD